MPRNIALQHQDVVLNNGSKVFRVYRKSVDGHRLIARFKDQDGKVVADFRETDAKEWAVANLKGQSAYNAANRFAQKMNENYRVLGRYSAVLFSPGDTLPRLERDEAEETAE